MTHIAAKDSSLAAKNDADIICDYKTDLTILDRAVRDADEEIYLALGTYNANGGVAQDGTRYLRPAHGVTIRAEPGAVLLADQAVCRIALDQDHVSLIGLSTRGWIGIQASASNLTLDGVSVTQSLVDGQHLDFQGRGGCTSAIQFWGDPRGVMHDITLTNIMVRDSFHHGIGFHLSGASTGAGPGLGTFRDVRLENFDLLNCGSGYIGGGEKDWSCAMDCDTGNVLRWIIKNGRVRDSWQTGLHWDGSWTESRPDHSDDHIQNIEDLVVEGVSIWSAGQRSNTKPLERYQSGIYAQSGTFRRIRTYNCYNCGMLLGNEVANSLVVEDFVDDASTIGMAVEYGGAGAKIQATLMDNLKRAYIGVGNNAQVDLTLVNPPKGPVLLGQMTKRIYAEAPGHAGDMTRYLNTSYNMRHSQYVIRTDLPAGTIWTIPSQSTPPKIQIVALGGVEVPVVVEVPAVEQTPPVVPVPATPGPETAAVASFTITPASAHVGDQVRFRVTPAPGKSIKSAWWTFDADGHYESWNSRDVNPSFFYPRAGTFTPLVILNYTDGTTEVHNSPGVKIA